MDSVIGFQITAADEDRITDFYTGVFDWGKSPGPHEHVTQLDTGQDNVDGSVIGRGEHIPDYVSLVIAVADLEASLARVVEHGGTVVRPPFTLPNGDTLAIAEDPEGHILTLQARPDGKG